jgi:hypothetical protein
MHEDPQRLPTHTRANYFPNYFPRQRVLPSSPAGVLVGQCHVSTSELLKDRFLSLTSDGDPLARRGRLLQLITIPDAQPNWVYLGLRLTMSELASMLETGIKGGNPHQYKLTLRSEQSSAVLDALTTAQSPLSPAERAISVFMQTDLNEINKSEIPVEQKGITSRTYSVWQDIPVSLIQKTFVYDHFRREFLLFAVAR